MSQPHIQAQQPGMKMMALQVTEEESQLMQPGFSTSWKMKLLDKTPIYYDIEIKSTSVLGEKLNRDKTHKSSLEQ